jgi:3-hydroxyisobutyrate dehydrogenase-like beta-hydroxyacid dehydrogenase
MGSAMARNLLRAGHEVAVYNRSRAKAEALAADGARIAGSPAEACRESEAAITMLADDPALEEVVFGDNGIASALSGAHISSSTISTAMAHRLAVEHARRGQGFLSAPVFGRPDAAESRKLIVVAGGGQDLIEHFRPVFDAIGRQTFIAGAEPWQANAVKLCGNFMIRISF